mgnify:FL=1
MYGKNTFEGTDVKVLYDNQGNPRTMCDQVNYCLRHRTMDKVIMNMKDKNHDFNFYKDPGAC